MKVVFHTPDDAATLTRLVAEETNAKQRDRYRAVLITGQGLGDQPELDRIHIAAAVGRSRQFIDEWVGRYRRGGLGDLKPKRQKGATPKLDAQQRRQLCDMLDAGPSPEEGISAYNGPILQQKIHQRFGQHYALSGIYQLLHRLGYNDLMPRTTHPQTSPEAMEEFKKKSSPPNSRKSKPPTPISK